jgi:hypothetical protein
MSNEPIDEEIFVDRPKRNHTAKKNKGGDAGWSGKAKKQYKHRVQELQEDDLDSDIEENWR